MEKITPFLWFSEQAEEAASLYTSIFKNGKLGKVTRFGKDMPGPEGKAMTVEFEIAGMEFTALNGGPQFSFTPANSFFVNCQTAEEIDTLWKHLSKDGSVLMEFGKYPFSEKFGWVNDRYGVSWQLNLSGLPQQIVPFLLFVGNQTGRAEEAVQYYTSLFPNSRVEEINHHSQGMGEVEGTVQHARFLLAGQTFIAMDSALDHRFTFTPAVSYMVLCENQEEVDFYWDHLTDGGEESMCGWLVDKFGVSWQVVPTALYTLLNDPDPEKAQRVTQAMLQMRKIDLRQLEEAREHA